MFFAAISAALGEEKKAWHMSLVETFPFVTKQNWQLVPVTCYESVNFVFAFAVLFAYITKMTIKCIRIFSPSNRVIACFDDVKKPTGCTRKGFVCFLLKRTFMNRDIKKLLSLNYTLYNCPIPEASLIVPDFTI